MGAAKRRGTFEERKAMAIEKQKIEDDNPPIVSNIGQGKSGMVGASMLLGMAAAMNGPLNRDKSIFR